MATATYTDTPVSPGVFRYSLTLNNTGTTTIGTFWFSWVPGAGFLPAPPGNAHSPANWGDAFTNGNSAIMWTASNPGADLAAGNSLSGFQFDSTVTPAQLQSVVPGFGSDIVATSFVYIGPAFGDPGFQLAAAPVRASTPEPATLAMAALAIGLGGCARRLLSARSCRHQGT